MYIIISPQPRKSESVLSPVVIAIVTKTGMVSISNTVTSLKYLDKLEYLNRLPFFICRNHSIIR